MAGEPRSPPVKVLAAQLRQCRRAAGGPWLLGREEAGQGPLAVPVVWMQGTVLAVEAGGARGGSARLQDESGPFTVLGVERVPKGRPCLSAVRGPDTPEHHWNPVCQAPGYNTWSMKPSPASPMRQKHLQPGQEVWGSKSPAKVGIAGRKVCNGDGLGTLLQSRAYSSSCEDD